MTQTVFVTGASGFIAKHIVAGLLNRGHHVVGSVRSLSRADEVRDAVKPVLSDTSDLDARLRFVALDLGSDEGWDAAMAGVDVLMHTASPFPMVQPDDPQAIIRPAVDGALRALKAAHAAGIKRVIFTSSIVSVMYGNAPANGTAFTEEDWTDVDAPDVLPYSQSKTLAERAAWDFIASDAAEIAMTTINPALVAGPALDAHFGTSLQIIERLLGGKDPMLPMFGFNIVDVRDVAEAHIRAMERPETAGERLIVSNGWMWFPEVAQAMKEGLPGRRIVTRVAPTFVVKLIGLFDKSVKSLIPTLNRKDLCDGSKAAKMLGLDYIAPEASVLASAQSIITHKGL
ncbi:SDR family oxidoreductase [Yoonia sp. R2331]|uniref:SDR family oxidoreductase n=1 Tax=Yoonia sp. R2331 TaxID=3237238 RepID=UPI0034E5F078